MQATDQAFFEAYKRLDRLCSDAFSCRNGVTAYIDEMNRCSPRGRRLVPGWEQDLSTLKALRHLRLGRVVIFAAGTGNPFMTTDTTAALRGAEVGADIVLKATKVDGIYTADPKKDPTATMYDEITFDEALRSNLKVMDATAFALCREQGLPIKVFNINKKGALRRVLLGEKEGTLVHS